MRCDVLKRSAARWMIGRFGSASRIEPGEEAVRCSWTAYPVRRDPDHQALAAWFEPGRRTPTPQRANPRVRSTPASQRHIRMLSTNAADMYQLH